MMLKVMSTLAVWYIRISAAPSRGVVHRVLYMSRRSGQTQASYECNSNEVRIDDIRTREREYCPLEADIDFERSKYVAPHKSSPHCCAN